MTPPCRVPVELISVMLKVSEASPLVHFYYGLIRVKGAFTALAEPRPLSTLQATADGGQVSFFFCHGFTRDLECETIRLHETHSRCYTYFRSGKMKIDLAKRDTRTRITSNFRVTLSSLLTEIFRSNVFVLRLIFRLSLIR